MINHLFLGTPIFGNTHLCFGELSQATTLALGIPGSPTSSRHFKTGWELGTTIFKVVDFHWESHDSFVL